MKGVDLDNLEITEGGDGVEYEVWIDTTTDKLYSVPIEIVRYWDEMKEL
mgnify:FL=1|tara:strand:+ start:349 stop:495 length:147 start_codon:yes stop_codon:yes gene_type:complete